MYFVYVPLSSFLSNYFIIFLDNELTYIIYQMVIEKVPCSVPLVSLRCPFRFVLTFEYLIRACLQIKYDHLELSLS